MRVGLPVDLAERHGMAGIYGQGLAVSVQRQGNFTLALLYQGDEVVSFGIAKRNVCDIERPDHAARLAISRALRRVW